LAGGRESGVGSLAVRLGARPALDSSRAAWTRDGTPENTAATLQAAGMSAMLVQKPDDQRADPRLAARGAIVTDVHPEIGPERQIGNPIRMSVTPLAPPRPAPLLGEHTEEVLTRLLGLGRDAVARLVEEGGCR